MISQESFTAYCEELRSRRYEAGIIETIAMFNLLGIPTVSSCEGHAIHRDEEGWDICPNISFRNGSEIEVRMLLDLYYGESLPLDYHYDVYVDGGYAYLDPIIRVLIFRQLAQCSLKLKLYEHIKQPFLEKYHDLARAEMRDFTEFLKNKFLAK